MLRSGSPETDSTSGTEAIYHNPLSPERAERHRSRLETWLATGSGVFPHNAEHLTDLGPHDTSKQHTPIQRDREHVGAAGSCTPGADDVSPPAEIVEITTALEHLTIDSERTAIIGGRTQGESKGSGSGKWMHPETSLLNPLSFLGNSWVEREECRASQSQEESFLFSFPDIQHPETSFATSQARPDNSRHLPEAVQGERPSLRNAGSPRSPIPVHNPESSKALPGGHSETDKMEMPDLGACGRFDGKESAARWLARLKWQFRKAGHVMPPPSEYIQVVNMQAEGSVATFLDSDPTLQAILRRAEEGGALSQDIEALDQALRDRFPAQLVDESTVQPSEEWKSLTQEKNEALAAYYNRAQNLLRRMGARDAPRDVTAFQANPLSALETFSLKTVIDKFVQGLEDAQLKQEAISRSLGTTGALWQCYEGLRECQRVIESREELQKQAADKMRLQMLESIVKDNTGLSVDQAIMKAYPGWQFAFQGTPAGLPSNLTSLAMHAQSPWMMTSSVSALPPPQSTARVRETGQPPTNATVSQGANQLSSQDARHAQTPNIAPFQNTPPTRSNGMPGRGGFRGGLRGGYGGAYTARVGNSNSRVQLPPRSQSKNPFVNGSESIAGKRVCFGCGKVGHFQPACESEEKLLPWERSYLRALIFPDDQKGVAFSQTAQLYYDNFLVDMGVIPAEEGHPGTDTPSVEAEIISQGALESAVQSSAEVRSLTVSEVAAEETQMSEDLQDEVLMLKSLLSSATDRRSRSPGRGDRRGRDREYRERHYRRREEGRTIPVESMLNPEEREKTATKKKARAPRREGPPAPMSEIKGREGMGPLNWERIFQDIKVEFSLMDLFQASPDCARNAKYYSTRVSEKTRKKAQKTRGLQTVIESKSATAIQPVKAYRMDVVLKFLGTNGKTVSHAVGEKATQADQGSDINFVSSDLVQKAGIKRRLLKDIGIEQLFIITSTSQASPVTEFVVFNVGVQGIWRSVWAIVRPEIKIPQIPGDTKLLLGLPWLWDVNGVFDIRQSSLTIGDAQEGERVVSLKGPILSWAAGHKLALTTKPGSPALDLMAVASDTESATEDSSGDSDTDSENSEGESGN
ncbi:uncharacterized protein JN550_004212 [Neoarthrinium moseri]|uniref:uncharacterized protein n=1 Tax=Neoarthrinium moseri TaxID=1658444 RepID=UPI001FDE05A8|nr:uncharacterized protein JN550_004212 [Neoarthrinium moseri]KAI1872009.1 hypothetical protein JN550_004212 [Neoarthrinium moseri]